MNVKCNRGEDGANVTMTRIACNECMHGGRGQEDV